MAAWDDEQRRAFKLANERANRDVFNLWHGIMERERESRKPGLSRKAWLGIAFGLYVSFMLGLFAWVLWKVAHPLPHLMP